MAIGVSHPGQGAEVLSFNVSDVAGSLTPCPDNFRAKVAYWKDTIADEVRPRALKLEDIVKKQERAQQQREALQQWMTSRTSRKRCAEERPQQSKKPKQKEINAEVLAEKLRSAASARHSTLESVSRSAGERVARAKAVAASGREAAAALAVSRLRLSQARQAAAAARRASSLRNISAAHAHRTPDAFLRANAAKLERIRAALALMRIQATWRHFVAIHRTTCAAVDGFVDTTVPGTFQPALKRVDRAHADGLGQDPAVGTNTSTPDVPLSTSPQSPSIGLFGNGTGMQWQRDFDDLTATMQAPSTLAATRKLLRRLEMLLRVLHQDSNPDCNMLLRRLYPKAARSGARIDRYPSRIFLCAYMLMWQPDMLLNGTSEWDERLKSTASALVAAFENVIVSYIIEKEPAAAEGSDGEGSVPAVRAALKLFDEAWVDFLEIFVTWKGEDAASIEGDLVRMAVDMQASMLAAVGVAHASHAAEAAESNVQLAAIVAQVEHDQALLRSRVERLSGPEAVARFDAAIAEATPSTRPRSAPRSPSRSPASSRVPSHTGQAAAVTPGTPPGARQATPPAPTAETPVVAPPDQNEVILHELLLNPSFRLPLDSVSRRWEAVMRATGDRVPMEALDVSQADPAALRAHITATAQDALADAALRQLAEAPVDAAAPALEAARAASFGQVAEVVSELAAEAFATLPESHPARQQEAEFSRESLAAMLERAPTLQQCVAAVAGLLDRTVQLLLQIGAPGREKKAREAVGRITAMLHTALASAAPDSAPQHAAVGKVLSRALRLLMAQMRVLNADGANGRLAMLAAVLTPAEALRVARGKLDARAGLAATPSGDAPQQQGSVAEKLPISARFASSSPSAEFLRQKVDALRSAYGSKPTASLPATIQAGRRTATSSEPAPPPGSLLATPILLAATAPNTWQARFRAATAALLVQPADLANNPQGPEVLHVYGGALDRAKGMYQKAVVIAVCMRVAADTAAAMGQAPLSQDEATALLRRLSSIEAAGSDALIGVTATIIADALSRHAPASGTSQRITEVEQEVKGALNSVLSHGSTGLQEAAQEVMHALQALLVFGRCEGFEGLPGSFMAPEVPAKWATALLTGPLTVVPLHGMVGEVAHELGRVCATAEAAYGSHLETLFQAS